MSDNKTMDTAEKLGFLEKIHEEYVKLSERRGTALPVFDKTNLAGEDLLKKYQQYLKCLPSQFAMSNLCDPPCGDGACPPCSEWNSGEYEAYLKKLRNLNSV